ncbi:hypothetical protein [Microbacterium allomyrinae]|uniref:Uncharacterized protein n=1 Tax=Microbacterium allomyrinae TaxID=2830666 RepID=A0A9X1LS13_9MICO|nr:hypothetical protein [Microbacterium allomyrinae]MCC2030909.1 hypothetical protein [Microbacterium allomyrinae]
MSHRTREQDKDHIRIAHQTHEDAQVRATENAYRAIAQGEYRDERWYYGGREKPPVKKGPAPASVGNEPSGMTPEQVRARWDREAVVPGAPAVACIHAAEGVRPRGASAGPGWQRATPPCWPVASSPTVDNKEGTMRTTTKTHTEPCTRAAARMTRERASA